MDLNFHCFASKERAQEEWGFSAPSTTVQGHSIAVPAPQSERKPGLWPPQIVLRL
jgi:hypothetical protein